MSRSVRPLGAGQTAVGASVGGPLFDNLNVPIPTPVTTVYGRYGVGETTDIDVGLLVPVIRAIGLDAGISHQWWKASGTLPSFSTGARLALLVNGMALIGSTDPNSGKTYGVNPRLFEEIYGTVAWDVAPLWVLWTGLDVFAQVQSNRYRPSFLLGASVRVAPSWDVGLEGKWVAFATNQSSLAVDWTGIGGRGALALQFGATWYLGAL